MKVLVTGHAGYIGRVLVATLAEAGHEVTGLDSFLFENDLFGTPSQAPATEIRADVRDADEETLRGHDAVVFLAALCNDALGNLDPELTYEINHRATVRFAEIAKRAGVSRFIFSSSCSLYGASEVEALDEGASLNPQTPYGKTKVLVERDLAQLADDDFSPTYMRNATVFGISPALRLDLVVNDLTAHAVAEGRVLLKSDGTARRPLVHVADVARAFLAAVEAERGLVHDRAYNVGADRENHRIRDVAEIVRKGVPGSTVRYTEGADADTRTYRVSFARIERELPTAAARIGVRDGVEELRDAYERTGLTASDLTGGRYRRIRRILDLRATGGVDDRLRWTAVAGGASP